MNEISTVYVFLCVNVTNTNIMTSKYTSRLSSNNSVCDVNSTVIQLHDVKNKHVGNQLECYHVGIPKYWMLLSIPFAKKIN